MNELSNIITESDYLALINNLKSVVSIFGELGNILAKIRSSARGMVAFCWSYSRREANKVAYELASLCLGCSLFTLDDLVSPLCFNSDLI